jgi:NADPH2:quinone reductase
MRAIQALRYGGADTLSEQTIELHEPLPHQVRVRIEAAGVNFIDIYQRSGLYPTQEPVRLGLEGAGIVEAVGSEVRDLHVGTRVAWCDQPGSYATHALLAAGRVVRVPEAVSATQAAAVMLQGMTAHYLMHDTYAVQRGDTVLVHAAAGGVGLLLCQLGKRLGARVIGTTSSEAKAQLARQAGADEVILYTEESFAERARELTGGAGVQVVYDSVGKDTYQGSLASLAPRGMLVLFGQASGPVPPIDPALLAKGGSLYLTRASLFHYVASRADLERRAAAVLGWVGKGELSLRIERTFPLAAAAEAQRMLESRKTTGKLLLVPEAD